MKMRYAAIASQMQCPLHQRNARVIVYGERFDDLEVEIFCCCEPFVSRVRHALDKTGSHTAH
jgi:hypothetical protein